MKSIKYIQIFLCCLIAYHAQAKPLANQLWGNYTIYKSINDDFAVGTRLGLRYYDFTDGLYRFGISPEIKYKPSQTFNYYLGCRFFYYDTSSKVQEIEYRPWLGVKATHKLFSFMTMSHVAKWEHRLYENPQFDYESRLRYKLKFSSTVVEKNGHSLSLAFAPEFFSTLGAYDELTCNATRWGTPIIYKHSDKTTFELVPFVQTQHAGFLSQVDEHYGVLQVNIKTYL